MALSKIIVYTRVYCESDIFIDDGKYSVDSKGTISNAGQSSTLIDETSLFFKDLQSVIIFNIDFN